MAGGTETRGQWRSKLGFIFAASGSAIGLGAIWRFPYITGENGGGAFVLLYIFFLVVVAIPYMFCELALGRATGKNPVGAVSTIRPRSWWVIGGILSVLTAVFICSYYAVIGSWAFGYVFKSLMNQSGNFNGFASDVRVVIPLFACFLAVNAVIVYKGVENGIERWVKLLMPLLVLLLLALLIKSLFLPGAARGIQFYLKPDFSKITADAVLAALGQAFFSLSAGMGVMITYSSYLSEKEDMALSGIIVTIFTTFIALVMGAIIFASLFSFGEDPASGPTLIFIVLPELFAKMPFGNIMGGLFFILASVAALTTIISFLEVPVSYFVDDRRSGRKYAVLGASVFIFIAGIPSALGAGSVKALGRMPFFGGETFLDFMDFIWGTVGILAASLALCVFVGWVWGAKNALAELEKGSAFMRKRFLLVFPFTNARVWSFFVRYVCPPVILIVLLDVLKII